MQEELRMLVGYLPFLSEPTSKWRSPPQPPPSRVVRFTGRGQAGLGRARGRAGPLQGPVVVLTQRRDLPRDRAGCPPHQSRDQGARARRGTQGARVRRARFVTLSEIRSSSPQLTNAEWGGYACRVRVDAEGFARARGQRGESAPARSRRPDARRDTDADARGAACRPTGSQGCAGTSQGYKIEFSCCLVGAEGAGVGRRGRRSRRSRAGR